MTQNQLKAAVLVPLLIDGTESHTKRLHLKTPAGNRIEIPSSAKMLLTLRSDTVEHHKGQISFPGGAFESSDASLQHTALRESFEEIGLRPEDVEVTLELPQVFTLVSNFIVKPYVGLVRKPVLLAPNPHEIEKILHVPLEHLLNPVHSQIETYERNGVKYHIRAYQFEAHRIWGATAMMIQTLLEKYLIISTD